MTKRIPQPALTGAARERQRLVLAMLVELQLADCSVVQRGEGLTATRGGRTWHFEDAVAAHSLVRSAV